MQSPWWILGQKLAYWGLSGFIAGPFPIQVGANVQYLNLYVAPLKDSMLLGTYFLRECKAKLDLGHSILSGEGG